MVLKRSTVAYISAYDFVFIRERLCPMPVTMRRLAINPKIRISRTSSPTAELLPTKNETASMVKAQTMEIAIGIRFIPE